MPHRANARDGRFDEEDVGFLLESEWVVEREEADVECSVKQ